VDDPTPGPAYRASAESLIELSTLHAHLLGIIHANRNIEQQEDAAALRITDGIVQLFAIQDDIEEVIDDKTIDSILEDAGVDIEYVEELQKEMAGMVNDRAKLDFYDSMKSLRSILAENVPTGLGYRDFLDKIGRDQAMANIGLAGESPYYIETVYRTNYGTAHSAGRWKSAQESPLVLMLQYVAVNDNRTTKDICKPLNGTIRKKTDPFWSTYNPLNHFS
jgi:SPP1 gp7 family putative phage head morphogenesis protein